MSLRVSYCLEQGQATPQYPTHMPADPLDNWFVQDASRLAGEVFRIQRAKGRVSALMQKGPLPDGMGFNFVTPIVKRSNPTGGVTWYDVAQENGTTNNCVPNASVLSPATTTLSYSAVQARIVSNDICFEDARMGYNFMEQVAAQRENFVGVVVDTWEDRDKLAFFTNAGHKIVFDGSLTESNSSTMPLVAPSYQINQALLDVLYNRIIQDGGGMEPYAMANGVPLITAVMSMEANRTLIRGDASIRQDFNYADMGKGTQSTLLQSWGIDRAYGGFVHVIDVRMPRFNFVGGAWVEVPYYTNQATTIGVEAVVNPAYNNAEYEDLYLWHPQVVKRLVPKPIGSVGADTRGTPVNFNGDITWLNIPNKETNPLGNIGFWNASLKAAYKPEKVQYGYVVRFKRCPQVIGEECVYGG